jgi:TRAP-type C4-dicarboxylate transport system permease small subunit
MGRRQRLCANLLSLVLLLGFSILLVIQGYLGFIDSLKYDGRAYTINIPYWPFYGLISFVGLVCAGLSLLNLVTPSASDSANDDSIGNSSLVNSSLVNKAGSDHL